MQEASLVPSFARPWSKVPLTLAEVESSALVSALIVLLIVFIVDRGLHSIQKVAKHHLRSILQDSDGYYSLTHFQFFSWTVVFLFSLIWVYLVRLQGGVLNPIPQLPANTLALMGINTVSAIGSSAIKEQFDKATAPSPKGFWGMFYSDQADRPDLTRVQFFMWTVVSIIIYLAALIGLMFGQYFWGFSPVLPQMLTIPDVDASLVTLMGLSHTAYVGAKYVKSSSGAPPPPQATGTQPGTTQGK